MKLELCLIAFALLLFSQANAKTVNVRGYTTKTGRYVQPYKRTSPNHTKLDNWSHKGNVNPYSGKEGSK